MTPTAMSPTSEIQDRLTRAVEMAHAAGRVTLRYFQQVGLAVERKADCSPVTIADREAEQLLRERIRAAFPSDAIVGEELGEIPGDSGYRWILDPIDGTKSFIFGVPLYGTLIGIERDGRSLAGVIHIPALRETVYASQGAGCWYLRSDEPPVATRVSATRQLGDGLLVTSQVDTFAKRGAATAFDELGRKAFVTRTWGDAYGYLLVATGRAAVMIDPTLHVWDAAAVQPVIEEAGGRFTDWKGTPTIFSGDAIGSNGLVHDEILEVTRKFTPEGLNHKTLGRAAHPG